jgi:hypothetical protein
MQTEGAENARPEDGPIKHIGEAHKSTQREVTRLLIGLITLIALIVAAMYATMDRTHVNASVVREYAAIFVFPLMALLATAISFYFAERR